MKATDVKSSTYIDFNKENNKEDPTFEVGDHIRIQKHKNIFAKGIVPNGSDEFFVIKKVKNTVPWAYVISDLNGEEIVGTFYKNELQKTNQKEFKVEKVIKRKGNKLYVKWEGHDNSFNSWIVLPKGQRYKNFVSDMQMLQTFTTDPYSSTELSRPVSFSRVFPIDKFDYYHFIVTSTIP